MKYASVLERIAAWIIDLVIMGVIMMFLMGMGIVSIFLRGGMMDIITGMAIFSVFSVMFAYTIGLETLWNGQTLGKKALGIRVVKENSKKIKFQDALLRNILRIIDNQIAGVVGLVLIIVTKKRQRIGDLVAKTVVVKE